MILSSSGRLSRYSFTPASKVSFPSSLYPLCFKRVPSKSYIHVFGNVDKISSFSIGNLLICFLFIKRLQICLLIETFANKDRMIYNCFPGNHPMTFLISVVLPKNKASALDSCFHESHFLIAAIISLHSLYPTIFL